MAKVLKKTRNDGKQAKNQEMIAEPFLFVKRMKVLMKYCTSEYEEIISEAAGTPDYMMPFTSEERKNLVCCLLMAQQHQFAMLNLLETWVDTD